MKKTLFFLFVLPFGLFAQNEQITFNSSVENSNLKLVDLYKGTIATSLENGELSFVVNLPLTSVNENAVIITAKEMYKCTPSEFVG